MPAKSPIYCSTRICVIVVMAGTSSAGKVLRRAAEMRRDRIWRLVFVAESRLFADLDPATRAWALERYTLHPIGIYESPV
jgi:hypothetical protein